MTFANLHVHSTNGSLLDSIARTKDIVNFAYIHKQPAVAITDHGSMASTIDQFKACKEKGIKPIAGCEIYEVDDMKQKEFTKDNKEQRYHLLLLARTQQGYQNLLKIVSLAGTEGRYIKPRIDIPTIKQKGWGKGIIACTACMAGRLSKLLENDQFREAEAYLENLYKTFDDTYIEIQSHGTDNQIRLNKIIYSFINHKMLPTRYIITSDAHMIHDDDQDIHRMFVATGQSREVGESYKDCYMQTEDDVMRIMEPQIGKDAVKQALKNIQELVNSIQEINVGLDNEQQMPDIKTPPQYTSNTEYLKAFIKKGLEEKCKNLNLDKTTYQNRVDMELPVIVELGYVNYFLITHALMDAARKAKIPLGYARGSAGGCLILYLIGITQIDSIRWNLDFSRFANLGRKGSMADIDIDISKNRRKEMIDIAKDLFGKENVCGVSTFNTMTMKVGLRDIGKVMNEQEDSPYRYKIPYDLRDRAAKLMPEIQTKLPNGKEITKEQGFKRAIDSNKELAAMQKQFPLWFKYALALEGLPKSRGKNASAVIISPKYITEYGTLCLDKDGEPIMENEMHSLMDDILLTKFDFLG